MARVLAVLPTAAVLISTSGCLEIVDVVQPMEVRAGTTFEVAVSCKVEFDRYARESDTAYGLLAISVPDGFDVKGGSFRGAAGGKLRRRPGLGSRPWFDRPGYEWQVFGTRDYFRERDLAGRVLEVRLKLEAGEAPGDYRLAYRAGTAPAGVEGPDLSRVEFASVGIEQRWITVR
jgi:hypothetical protein